MSFCLPRFMHATFFVSDLSVFDIKLLPRDSLGNVIYPKVPKERGTAFIYV